MVTQIFITFTAAWVGKQANRLGRRPLLLIGFAVLPVHAVLYTLTHVPAALIAIQCLDGVANTIFGVVAVLVIADRRHGTGRFNLVSGALATAVGAGAALSNTYGGYLIHLAGFRVSFLGLGAVALIAFLVLFFSLPETEPDHSTRASLRPLSSPTRAPHEGKRASRCVASPHFSRFRSTTITSIGVSPAFTSACIVLGGFAGSQ